MTAITREYLDAVGARRDAMTAPYAEAGRAVVVEDVPALIAALRRVLDLRDDLVALERDHGGNASASVRDLDAALAGTQTERGDSFQSFGFDR
jgi:hypothetical protein